MILQLLINLLINVFTLIYFTHCNCVYIFNRKRAIQFIKEHFIFFFIKEFTHKRLTFAFYAKPKKIICFS